MRGIEAGSNTGVVAALMAAVLFGAGTPVAKLLLASLSPWLLAALLYLGSGLGLTLYRRVVRAPAVVLPRQEVSWFVGAVVSGGVIAPVLLMFGLSGMPASGASLLLNAEGVFTTLLAWFAFKENVDRRIAIGMLAIVAGALVLSWPGEVQVNALWPSLAILGACLAWGLDNNLTRKVSLTDAAWIASIKGLVAGAVNLALALFVVGLRHLGTARTGAYFSAAPFVGALLALATGDSLTPQLLLAGALMALGLWLHLSERHEHAHQHRALEHEHMHTHDEHHQHAHGAGVSSAVPHSHPHRHAPLYHAHPHFPDAHHRHKH